MKIARIYIRVSTTEQALEGYSIPAQKERLINFCKAKDYLVDDIYIDGGFTGSNLDRPGMDRMLRDIKERDTDIIVVYKLDRLSRSQKDTLHLIEDVFLANDISFISMQESFDTSTAFGRAMVGILSVFAQLERENIRERTMLGKEERAKEGLWGGGIDPFGYDYINGELIPNANAEIVKKAYKMYLEGAGTPSISRKIGNVGRSKVRGWLLAPVYAGKIAHAKKIYAGQHEPIISWETFLEVQEVMKCRAKKRGKPATVNVLAGLVKCKKCGALYGARSGGNHYYLCCYSRTGYIPEMIKDKNCRNNNWRLDEVVKFLEKDLFEIIYDKNYLSNLNNKKKDSGFDPSIIKKEITQLNKKADKIMELMLDESLQIDAVKDKLIKINNKKSQLEKLLIENKKPEKSQIIEDTIITIKESWGELSIEKKNELLRRLIKVIWVDGLVLEIEYNF